MSSLRITSTFCSNSSDKHLVAADAEDALWREQARHTVVDLETLESTLILSDEERAGTKQALSGGLPLAITPYYLSLCDRVDPTCPIRKQCIPSISESVHVAGDLRDPLGEEHHEVAPHLIQRYPDRVLLIATDHCAVYCRFCTRSRIVGSGTGLRPLAELEQALGWLANHPEIHEVILSGGDPLLMSDRRIQALLDRLDAIDHLQVIRIASRLPVTLPQRLTRSLCSLLGSYNKVWLMTHFNHPKELQPEAQEACRRLVTSGIPIMNHTVLLRGVNDNAATLAELFRGLVAWRVKPYYLLQADPVRGTGHLRTPLDAGIDIMRSLQGQLSGLALPKFIVDTPGGLGKVPLGPNYIIAKTPGTTRLRTHRGVEVTYFDPPATGLRVP